MMRFYPFLLWVFSDFWLPLYHGVRKYLLREDIYIYIYVYICMYVYIYIYVEFGLVSVKRLWKISQCKSNSSNACLLKRSL